MAHQPDVQKHQQTQEQHQRLQELQNIVYIHQEHQNYRNQNYQFPLEEQNNLVGNQLFQQQNDNFGQFENPCPFVGNGHFPPSNSPATIIQQSFERNKNKNASTVFKNSQNASESNSRNSHQRNDAAFQVANANYQNLNYQQSSQFFLPNIGNQFQINDILVPTYQSSSSSESSDESSISNISQSHYLNESGGVLNNQFDFPVPTPTNQVNQDNRSFPQFQQKDFLENYGNILPQDSQIPRCDSSKSETAESTCSSLSSGSTESQSENENIIQVPVLVNPVLNNNGNCNILQSYQTNTQNNTPAYSNQMHHNQTSDINNQRTYTDHPEQSLLNSNINYVSTVNTDNATTTEINNVLPANNQMNNLVVMLPNHSKSIQNCLVANQSILQNPSSEILNTSKFIIQNQKANQQKFFGLINVSNQTSQKKIKSHAQMGQDIKFNNKNIQESCNNYDHISIKNAGKCGSIEESRNNNCMNGSNVHINIPKSNKNCITNNSYASNSGKLLLVENPLNESNAFDNIDNSTSQIQNTSDSSVISSSFIRNKHLTMPTENENSAIFSNETSDKSISQCISDVNSSLVDSTFLVKNGEKDIIQNICFDESSSTSASCLSANSSINALPVPVGWKRLLVDGSVIYLSPTNIALSSLEQVKMYLQTVGTCKCGLECPVHCDSVFNFNPKVISRSWTSSDSELTRLCNHKRKAPTPGPSVVGTEKTYKLNRKEAVPTKRKKKKHSGNSSGVSVSQLLAQRDRALAAAAARWSMNSRTGTVSCQNVMGNQYQNIQLVRNQSQNCPQISFENNTQATDVFKTETPLGRLTDVKHTQLPCINVINNIGREGAVLNVNGMTQLLPENHSTDHELLRPSVNAIINQGQEMGPGIINHAVNYGQSGQEFMANEVMGSRSEGVLLTPQGMVLPPNMIMQRPRSIPPWHQTKVGLDKKQVPETSVVYDRVSSIQQHMPPPTLIFEDATSRKKHKINSKIKKASQETIQNQPSFMDNPSAYLAQQTALLHNTISLPNFSVTRENRPVAVLPQNVSNLPTVTGSEGQRAVESNSNTVFSPNAVLSSSSKIIACNVRPVLGQKVEQSNFTQPQICHKNILEKATADSGEPTNPNQTYRDFPFNNHVCADANRSVCKKSDVLDLQKMAENRDESQLKEKFKIIQRNLENSSSNKNAYSKPISQKTDWRGFVNDQSTSRSEDSNNLLEESPVTSSTEKSPAVYNEKVISDSRPIQGGTVSTSNGSPQPQPSPKCLELTFQNPVPSSKSSFVVSSGICSSATRDNDIFSQFKTENSVNTKNIDVSQALSSFANYQQDPESPDPHHGYKALSSSFLDLKTCDRKFQQTADNLEDPAKSHSVSSTFDVQKEQNRKDRNNDIKGNRVVRTMASGHTVSSNTLTSVQAGKTQTATVTVSSSSPISPTTISLVNFSNQANVNLPVSQKGNTKTPLEMVQSVVSSIQTSPAVMKNEMQPSILALNKTVLPTSNVLNNILTTTTSMLANNSNNASLLKTSPGGLQAGHILVSNNGQYIVASNGNVIPQTNISGLKLNQANSMPSMSASPVVTSVTGAVTQVLPAVGVAQQVLGQPTVLVNALPAPFVIQPGVMAVDTGLGRLAVATGNVLQSSLVENNSLRSSIRGLSSPEKIKNKKGNKKRKTQVAPLVQVASPNNLILNQPFNQQNYALSPGGNVQPLQALTLLQGKHGGTAQIMMNNQNNFNQFNTQPQQINLLQPVNLTSVPNFPAFQQFIVPGLGNMVMSADGTTTILPDANIGVQLQLQNVNGQNVLTPVQNTSFINGQGILTTPAGMLIRAPNNQQKIVQNNSSSQFLSPNNSQFLVNQFQSQLSPLIAANLSPNQQIFTSSPPRQSPQEYIQIIPTSSSQNTTVVQQNTTIVQQQTTMVSNNQNILNNPAKSSFILNNPSVEKPVELQFLSSSQRHAHSSQAQPVSTQQPRCPTHDRIEIGTQHSVSTQTVINKEANNIGIATNNSFCQTLNSNWSGSPPDTTTHSPIEAESNQERVLSPLVERKSEDCLPQAMVQYVSSSISESENEGETYLLPGVPKLLTNCDVLPKSSDKAKNIVESSTVLQESGIQIQIGGSYVPSRRFKSTPEERVVSSHSDITVQDKHVESQSNIMSFQEDKTRLMDALLSETRTENADEEGEFIDSKEKLSEGDLVWGSVRGSLAWPGKLVGPISPGGRAMVRWFGGHASPSRVNVSQLQSLSQGLEAHHKASNKGRKNRRLNAELEAAIQEAMLELDKMTGQEKKISTGSGRPRRSNR